MPEELRGNMKKTICFIIAVLMLAASGCAAKNTVPGGAIDVGLPTARPKDTAPDGNNSPVTKEEAAFSFDGKGVTLINGRLEGSSYYWDFFMSKVNAGLPGSVTIINYEGETKTGWIVTRKRAGFTFVKDGQTREFSSLVILEIAAPADLEATRLTLGILTNETGLTEQTFFGGEAPSDIRAGFENEKGTVVFMRAD